MAHDVFISYSPEDKTTADAICSHLEGRGIRCWYAPRDIAPGEEQGDAVLRGIENAKIMVLVFTKEANLSQQVLRDVNNAVNSRLTIIPFRLTEELPAAGMRYYLSTVHWMDAMNEDIEKAIASLGDLCQAVLEKKPIPLSPPAWAKKGAVSGKKRGLIIAAIAAVLVLGIGVWAVVSMLSGSSFFYFDDDENTVSFDGNDPKENIKIEHDESSDEVLDLGAVSENVTDDLSVTYTDGNNQNNILNDGHLAFDGEWYYYTGNDGDRLHRMRADGTSEEKLTDIPVSCISVYEGYVYFVSDAGELFRIKTDGTELTSLVSYGVKWPRIQNGRIYYGEFSLSSVALDGSDAREENDISGYDVLIDGTYTYYTDPGRGQHIYRARMDGSEAVCIYNRESGGLRIAGNCLFFYDRDNGWFSTYDLSTGEVTQLTYDPVNAPVITKDGIYGWGGNAQLIYIQHGKAGFKLLTEGWADTVNVAGEKIFYRDCEDYEYYMMNLDGSDKNKL